MFSQSYSPWVTVEDKFRRTLGHAKIKHFLDLNIQRLIYDFHNMLMSSETPKKNNL